MKIIVSQILKTIVHISREIKVNSGRDSRLFATFALSQSENRSNA